jgi:hypothetical protein
MSRERPKDLPVTPIRIGDTRHGQEWQIQAALRLVDRGFRLVCGNRTNGTSAVGTAEVRTGQMNTSHRGTSNFRGGVLRAGKHATTRRGRRRGSQAGGTTWLGRTGAAHIRRNPGLAVTLSYLTSAKRLSGSPRTADARIELCSRSLLCRGRACPEYVSAIARWPGRGRRWSVAVRRNDLAAGFRP